MSDVIVDKQSAMERIGDDEELYQDIVNVFFDDAPQQIELLKTSFENQDRVTAERQAHSLKSASASIGGESMRAVCLKTEKSFATAPMEELCQLVKQVEEEFVKLREYFQK